jgi:ribosomal protein S14
LFRKLTQKLNKRRRSRQKKKNSNKRNNLKKKLRSCSSLKSRILNIQLKRPKKEQQSSKKSGRSRMQSVKQTYIVRSILLCRIRLRKSSYFLPHLTVGSAKSSMLTVKS